MIEPATIGYFFGGLGGAIAYAFTAIGLKSIMRGEIGLEIALMMFACVLIFIFTYQLGTRSTERRYDFDKHWHGRRMIFDHDPTIDLEARRPPDNPAEGYKLTGERTDFERNK